MNQTMEKGLARTKLACYASNITGMAIGNLPPLLFITFRQMYGIPYSLLGTLVLINFSTQLLADLVFSFFSHKFNIKLTLRLMPLITLAGLGLYALAPMLFPAHIYLGLALGTVVFSFAMGLGEVLLSPVIAAIPSENPEREMSRLHSIYAWGVILVVGISTVFQAVAGSENWQWLVILFALIQLLPAFLFLISPIPQLQSEDQKGSTAALLRDRNLWICVLSIFLGGAAECTMAQWSSGYLEQAFGIQKLWGDLLGVALFSVMLGLGRSLYAAMGKNIGKVLTLGAIGTTVCYFLIAVSNIPWVGLLACVLAGFCVSMCWPGNLMVASRKFPDSGVFIFAMMAAGGDLGASVVPQLVGIVTDGVMANPTAASLAAKLSLTTEQLGMRAGMLCGMLFPLIAILVYFRIWKKHTEQ